MKRTFITLAAVATLITLAASQVMAAATTNSLDTVTYSSVQLTGGTTNLFTWNLDFVPTHAYIAVVYNTVQVSPTLKAGRLFVGGMSNDGVRVGSVVAYTNALFRGVASGDVVRCALNGREGIWITSTNGAAENATKINVTLQKE